MNVGKKKCSPASTNPSFVVYLNENCIVQNLIMYYNRSVI